MKTKTIGLSATVAIGMMTVMGPATAETPKPGLAPTLTAVPASNGLALLPSVSLGCSGAGSSDVAKRKHAIKNTTSYAIPKGTVVHWSASDKGTGSVTLNSDLAPNGSVDVIEPGQTNGYSCTASFTPGPADYAVKSVTHSGGTASIVIQNLNPWTDAPASVAKLESMKCVTVPVKGVDVNVPAIPKGSSVTVTAPIAMDTYLRATANANGAVSETNKTNNVGTSFEYNSCIPK
jgi:hypothetical protein